MCFRVEESATTDGAQLAVIVLAGITVIVLGAFARFMTGFVKREAGLLKREREQPGDPEC